MNQLTILNCDCGKRYFVRYSPNQSAFFWRLDFSVCPYCGKPRNPKLFAEYEDRWHCALCHVPEPIVSRRHNKEGVKYGRWCTACYWFQRRTELMAGTAKVRVIVARKAKCAIIEVIKHAKGEYISN